MKRIDTIRRKAIAGDANAQVDLGLLYDQGRDIKKSYRKARQWYLEAARQGHRAAQYNLSLCYFLGLGCVRDERQAFRWARKSADSGFPDAVLAMGWHYHNGCGVTEDLRKAEDWYRKSAKSGDASAQFSLGQMFYDLGHYTSAKRWFLKAVAQNHPRLQLLSRPNVPRWPWCSKRRDDRKDFLAYSSQAPRSPRDASASKRES